MDLKELMGFLAMGFTKIIILSEQPVQLDEIEKIECKPLSSDDAFDFFVRELKKRKLTI